MSTHNVSFFFKPIDLKKAVDKAMSMSNYGMLIEETQDKSSIEITSGITLESY